MDSSTPAIPQRLRVSRRSLFSQWSGSDHHLQVPQAGPSRVSAHMDASDGSNDEDDDDNQPTPRVAARPTLENISDATPSQSVIESGAARLRAVLREEAQAQQQHRATRRQSPPRSRHDSVLDMDSDYDSPHATISHSVHMDRFKDLFNKVRQDMTPEKRPVRRRNSIDSSEVEDSPRVAQVLQERARHKGKRKSASDEEAELLAKSAEGSEISRHASSAAKFDELHDRLSASLSTPRAPQEPTNNTAFSMGRAMSGAEELLDLEPPTDIDMSAETSGDTAKILRQMDREASTSTPPVATSTPLRSVTMPAHFQSQSNLLEQNSTMENAMKGLESEEESGFSQRRLPFPPSRLPARPLSPDAASRAHHKSHSAHNLPIPRRVSGGRESTSSRSSSLSATDFQDRVRDGDREQLYERERQWNKPLPQPRTPESGRRVSQGSPSYNLTVVPDRGSPGQRVMSRRASSASMNRFDDGRSSLGSSISSQADYRERMADMDDDHLRERERMWNKPRPRRSSSSLSSQSPNERSRTHSNPARPGSEQSFNRIGGRPTSWHSPNHPVQSPARPGSPTGSLGSVGQSDDNPIVVERERNWNSPHPKWEYQVPRAMSPLPPPPPVSGSGYGRPPADWTPVQAGSPSRSRHTSLTNGRRASYERSRTSSLSDEFAPSKQSPLVRASTDTQIGRAHSPTPSDIAGDDRFKNTGSRFGWAFPRKRANLPPFERDADSPQKRPSTPPGSGPSSSLSVRPSHIPIRSPSRRGDVSSPQPKSEDYFDRRDEHRRTSGGFGEGSRPIAQRSKIEPIDLINVETEDLVPTDIESGSDRESQVTSTPVARPTTLPESVNPDPTPSEHYEDPQDSSSRQDDASEYPDTFMTAPSEDLSHMREDRPDSPAGFSTLSTPPRRSFLNSSKMEFQTPSPPRNMPELPGPPSSEEDETDQDGTPVNARVSLLADFTAAKTPRPPGAWAATPVPAPAPPPAPLEEREQPTAGPSHPPEAETPVPAGGKIEPPPSAGPTPAPPGAWQATPAGSLRRKSILKVRFDVDPNTSAESMPEVPMVGPSDPADSMSEVFPPLVPSSSAPAKDAPATQPAKVPPSEPERPTTPPTVRARLRPKSPGVRVLDAFGNETVDDSPVPSASSSVISEDAQVQPDPPAPAAPQLPAGSTPRSKSLVRIVDAMGREVTSEADQPAEGNSAEDRPLSHRESLMRLRETVSQLADEFGDSDDSRIVSNRDDQRLHELLRASQAARTARSSISESLQKHRAGDPDVDIRHDLPSGKNKLLPPGIRSSRFSIDFLNTWVLWAFLILQILLLIYMYRLSTIRAKQLFLTTYYDAFSPALFSHLSKSQSMQRALPPSSSPSPAPFSIVDALTREGWKGALAEAYARTTVLVAEWRNHLWDVWGQHPGRTNVWPPT